MAKSTSNTLQIDLALNGRADVAAYRKEIEATKKAVNDLKKDLKAVSDISKSLQMKSIYNTKGGLGSYNAGQEFKAKQSADRMSQLGDGKSPERMRETLTLSNRLAKTYEQQNQIQTALGLKLGTQEATLRRITSINELNARIEATKIRRNIEFGNENKKAVTSMERQLGILEDQLATQQRLTAEAAKSLAQRQKAAAQPALDRSNLARDRSRNEQRLLGDGGASLFKIQTGLLANYTIINGLQQAFSASVAFTVELDNSLRNLQAIVKVTDNGMVSLKESILKASEASRFSATEVAEAAVTLGQAGFSTDQIEKSIGAITNLATATGTDLAKSVDIATSIIGIFNLEAGRMTEVANTLTSAMNMSKLDMEKLTLGIQYAGNTAYDSGVSFEELTAALGAMANAGIRSGSTLGTGMRQILVSLEKPSEAFEKNLGKLGLTTYDVDLKTKGLAQVMKTLRDAGFSASDAIQSFEVRSAAAFIALQNNLDYMDTFEASLYGSAAAAEANATQMRSLSNQFKNFTSISSSIVSEALQPMLFAMRDLFLNLNEAIKGVRLNGDALRQWGTAIAATVLALGGFKIISLIQGLVLGLNLGVGTLRTTMIAGSVAFSLNSAVMGTWTATAIAAGTALKAGLMALFPIMIPLMAAVAVGYYAMGGATSAFAKEQQNLTNKMDMVKTAIDRQKGVIDGLKTKMGEVDGKIVSLINRQAELAGDTKALNKEIDHVRRQFSGMGYEVSSADSSVAQLIAKLQALRAQLAQDYTLAINVQIGNIAALEAIQTATIANNINGLSGLDGSSLSPAQNELLTKLSRTRDPVERSALQSQLTAEISKLAPEASGPDYVNDDTAVTTDGNGNVIGTGAVVTNPRKAIAGKQLSVLTEASRLSDGVLLAQDSLTGLRQQTEQLAVDAETQTQVGNPSYTPMINSGISTQAAIATNLSKIEKNTKGRPSDRMTAFYDYAQPLISAIDQNIEGIKVSGLTEENKQKSIADLEAAKGSLIAAEQKWAPEAEVLQRGTLGLKGNNFNDQYTDNLRYMGDAETEADVSGFVTTGKKLAEKRRDNAKAQIMVGVKPGGEIDAQRQVQLAELDQKYESDLKEIEQAASERVQTLNKPKDGGGGGGTDNSFQNMMNDFKTGIETAEGDLKYGDTTAPAAVAQMDGIITKAREELEIRRATMETLAVGSAAYNAAKKEENQLLTFIRENEAAIRDLKEEQGLAQFSLTKSIQEWATQNLNIAAGFEEGFSNVLSSMKSGLSSLFTDLVNGTKTAKEAFRDFGISVVQSIQNVIAEMVAMYVMKKVLGMFGQTLGGTSGMEMVPVGTEMMGGVIRKAGGGMVEGNLARDSKLHNLMPGEYVLRKSAVDMIGVDALDKMNSMGNRAMAGGGHVGVAKKEKGPMGQTNVYVVSPDQQPVPGPSDIIAIINDDISRGGSTKRLIKTVAMGF